VNDLKSENLLRVTGDSEFSGGRKRPLISLNASDNLSVAVDLGGTKTYGAVCDLCGNILHERSVRNHGSQGEHSYRILRRMIEELLETADARGWNIRGIGIGVPGVTDNETGVVKWAPSLKWRDFPLKSRIIGDFKKTVVVDNDVNLAALGELWFGKGSKASNLVLIAIGTGLGAGLILDGMLYRGSNLFAGEIGYMPYERACLDQEYPLWGPMEMVAAGAGIASIAKGRLKGLSQEESDSITGQSVFEACRAKSPWAVEIVSDMADYLSMAVISACSVVDPDIVILGGGISHSADLFIDRIRERLKGRIPHEVSICASDLAEKATVLGAMISLLHNTANFCIVRQLGE
jgi:glucokinase-like ROK family protein